MEELTAVLFASGFNYYKLFILISVVDKSVQRLRKARQIGLARELVWKLHSIMLHFSSELDWEGFFHFFAKDTQLIKLSWTVLLLSVIGLGMLVHYT